MFDSHKIDDYFDGKRPFENAKPDDKPKTSVWLRFVKLGFPCLAAAILGVMVVMPNIKKSVDLQDDITVPRKNEMENCISQVLEQVGREKIAGLYTTGGDTMVNVCYQLGVECIEVMDYVIPQTDVGRLVGKYDGLPVVGKGGLTGNDNTACDIVERLFKEAAR